MNITLSVSLDLIKEVIRKYSGVAVLSENPVYQKHPPMSRNENVISCMRTVLKYKKLLCYINYLQHPFTDIKTE